MADEIITGPTAASVIVAAPIRSATFGFIAKRLSDYAAPRSRPLPPMGGRKRPILGRGVELAASGGPVLNSPHLDGNRDPSKGSGPVQDETPSPAWVPTSVGMSGVI